MQFSKLEHDCTSSTDLQWYQPLNARSESLRRDRLDHSGGSLRAMGWWGRRSDVGNGNGNWNVRCGTRVRIVRCERANAAKSAGADKSWADPFRLEMRLNPARRRAIKLVSSGHLQVDPDGGRGREARVCKSQEDSRSWVKTRRIAARIGGSEESRTTRGEGASSLVGGGRGSAKAACGAVLCFR